MERDSPKDVLASATTEVPSQYLTVGLGEEVFAVSITRIREVVEYGGVTPMPLTSPTVPGVINLRGAVIPVVDLGLRLERAQSSRGRRSCIVIVEGESDRGVVPVGLMVDAVHEALDVRASQLLPPPAFGTGLPLVFVEGVLSLADRFVTVVDMVAVLAMSELEELVAESNDRLRLNWSREAQVMSAGVGV